MLALIRAYFAHLRCAISHPFALESFIRKRLSLESIQSLREELSKLGKEPVYKQIGTSLLLQRERADPATANTGVEEEAGGATAFGSSNFGGYFNMDEILKLAESEAIVRDTVCLLCPEGTVDATAEAIVSPDGEDDDEISSDSFSQTPKLPHKALVGFAVVPPFRQRS
jgi:hypothetical protein